MTFHSALSRLRGHLPQITLGLAFCVALLLALHRPLLAAANATPAQPHTFTTDGGQTVSAQITGVADGNVSLKSVDGKSLKLALTSLNRVDQDFTNQWQLKNALATHVKILDFEAVEMMAGSQKLSSGENRATLCYKVKMTNVSNFPIPQPKIQYIVASRSNLQIPKMTCDLTFGTYQPTVLAPGQSLSFPTENALETENDSKLLGVRVRVSDSNNQLICDWGSPSNILTRIYAPFPKSGSGTAFNSHDSPGGNKGSGGNIVAPTYDSSFPMPGE